jgi:hypothetical protein
MEDNMGMVVDYSMVEEVEEVEEVMGEVKYNKMVVYNKEKEEVENRTAVVTVVDKVGNSY